jgi:hypothetical protein
MISQGWPLYAVDKSEGVVYAVVAWANDEPVGVRVGGEARYQTAESLGATQVVLTPDLNEARYLARSDR